MYTGAMFADESPRGHSAGLLNFQLRVRAIDTMCEFGTTFEHARDIDSCLAFMHPTSAYYKAAVYRLIFNIASNQALMDVSANELCLMTNEEMARGTIVERVQKQEQQRRQMYINLLKDKANEVQSNEENSLIKCRKCGSDDLSFSQVQLRSADEPMSCFFSCNGCGNRWRMQ